MLTLITSIHHQMVASNLTFFSVTCQFRQSQNLHSSNSNPFFFCLLNRNEKCASFMRNHFAALIVVQFFFRSDFAIFFSIFKFILPNNAAKILQQQSKMNFINLLCHRFSLNVTSFSLAQRGIERHEGKKSFMNY